MSAKTPVKILKSDGCKVQSLTVSDQHATLLISHASDQEGNGHCDDSEISSIQSLLKFTIVPFHKSILGCNPVLTQDDIKNGEPPERNMLHHDNGASLSILEFLLGFDFELKSESGAEYSYFIAKPKNGGVHQNNCNTDESLATAQKTNIDNVLQEASAASGSFDVELISPASSAQISRALPTLGHVLINETPEMYISVVKPYIQSVVDGGSLSWITNVIELKKEKERLLFRNNDFVINVDTKWRTHPPPLTTPREEWLNHQCVEDLYCLAITKIAGITSIRDLREEHIPMLKSISKEGLSVIKDVYGVDSDQIRIFIHYQPQFYHFHVHFTRLENEVGCSCERGHLLNDVIQNLEIDSDFYLKRTLTYKLKKGTPLENIVRTYLSSRVS